MTFLSSRFSWLIEDPQTLETIAILSGNDAICVRNSSRVKLAIIVTSVFAKKTIVTAQGRVVHVRRTTTFLQESTQSRPAHQLHLKRMSAKTISKNHASRNHS
jgi:hypothetical protein